MADQTITLSYEERSRLLTFLSMAGPEIHKRYPEMVGTYEAITQRVSRLECQPGGCPYCNAEAAREESERLDDMYMTEQETDHE